MEDVKESARALKALRRSRRLSQVDVAEYIGVHRNLYCRREQNPEELTMREMRAIAAAFTAANPAKPVAAHALLKYLSKMEEGFSE